jgi:hypothetical protein
MSKSLFMESTEIPTERTVSQIQEVLMRHKASAILTEMKNGEIDSISFKHDVGGVAVPFRLPCRAAAIEQILVSRNRKTFTTDREKENRRLRARRIAWRQILRWVEAQMALVETNMVKIEEVFFPYIQTKNGQTIYELHSGNLLQLGVGK